MNGQHTLSRVFVCLFQGTVCLQGAAEMTFSPENAFSRFKEPRLSTVLGINIVNSLYNRWLTLYSGVIVLWGFVIPAFLDR